MTPNTPRHYEATATRDNDRWWLIEVPGIGATQSRTLASAEDQARDLIAAVLDIDIDDVTVDVVPDLGDQVLNDVREIRRRLQDVATANRIAAEQSRRLAASLVHRHHLTGADAATVLGVSPQRVSQLLRDREPADR